MEVNDFEENNLVISYEDKDEEDSVVDEVFFK